MSFEVLVFLVPDIFALEIAEFMNQSKTRSLMVFVMFTIQFHNVRYER